MAELNRNDILTEIAVLKSFMDKLRDDNNKKDYIEIEKQYYELLDKLKNEHEDI